MTAATVLSGGQINGSGDTKALFLKVYGGEVLTAFDEYCAFKDKHMVRTISSGKSAQFPVTWKVTSAYHTPGNEILGQAANQNEMVINIDKLLVSSVFTASIDEAMSHYDFRSEYSRQTGQALANKFDTNVAIVGLLAARTSTAPVTGGNGGSSLVVTNSGTDSGAIADGLWQAAQKLDEKDIPEMDRYGYYRPAQYYLLAQNTTVLNQDWGGSGAYKDGKVLSIAGVNIVKTNHLPITNIANPNDGTIYFGNFSTTTGLIMNKNAVGTVKLMDLAVESEYDIRRQGTLIVSKYAVGHGVLRPDCAVEIKSV